MTRHDLEKLLGGYAAGTLTPEERRALFDAALADQTLFDALADEEALREVLADPTCRERVQAALVERPPTAFWLRRPAAWTLAAATALAAVVLTIVVLRTQHSRRTVSSPQQIAMANKPALPDLVPSTPAPAPAATRPREAERTTPRAPAAAGKSEQRVTKSFSPPGLATPRRETVPHAPGFAAEPFPPPGIGVVGGRLDSPAPAATDALAAGAPLARSAQMAQPARKAQTAPPPPPASTESVTVVSASPMIMPAQSEAQSQHIESKELSRVSIAGRDAAELIKVMPGMAAAGKQGPVGLRYTLFRRGAGDKDVEVPPDTPFGRRESVHLRIEPGQGGYLYVLAGKRALFAGPVVANQPVLIVTRPGVLNAVLLPQPDSGPLSTLVSRARQQQLEGVRFQRSDGTHLGVPGQSQPAPILVEISITSR